MMHETICEWLGIPPQSWPPNHYAMLGLPVGEPDISLIEQSVHQRLDIVRRYQLQHPELATEAMTRLAQAFICLTDSGSKRSYDAQFPGLPTIPPPSGPAEPAEPTKEVAPPVLPQAPSPPLPPILPPPLVWPNPPPVTEEMAEEESSVPTNAPTPRAEPRDAVVDAAQRSPASLRGLASKRALFRRVARTRQLLRLWGQVGQSLENPDRRLARAEAIGLLGFLEEIQDVLDDFPPPLGEAGQPGYLVVTLADMENARSHVQNLSVSQRESLARDWKSGMKFLAAHRDFLRREVHSMRRRGPASRFLRVVRAILNEPPTAAIVVAMAILALVVALYRTFINI
jgi:hypothetical protein